jgi:tRNA nucleotidyltransferase (CCA-adding enzyme)
MHMPSGNHLAPIVACAGEERLRRLLAALAPQRWPFDPALLPPGTVLVGGAVRDGLLGRLKQQPDLDVVLPDDATALARRLARRLGGSCVVLDAERDIARLVLDGWSLDLARREGADLDADLARRDYTVNAIGLRLPAWGEAELLDPQGGLGHLEARQLVAIAEANLIDDPLRLLRGIRLACELAFGIEAGTLALIRRHHQLLPSVAPERVLAELERIAAAPGGAAGLQDALGCGLLAPWVAGEGVAAATAALAPLTPACLAERGLSAAEGAQALPLARFAVLFEAAALGRLHASRRLQQQVERLRRWWQRLPQGEPTAASPLEALNEADRLLLQRQLEEELPALLLLLPPVPARAALQRWRDPADPLFHPRPPLDGHQLQQALALPPGRLLGDLLTHLSGERAFGRLASDADHEQTMTQSRRWLAEQAARHD